MKHARKFLAMALAATAFSCDVNELALENTGGKQEARGKNSPISAKLEKDGFYLDFSRLDESNVPDGLKDGVAVFQIALQSGDQPVLGGTIEAFEAGNCRVTEVPWGGTVSSSANGGIATATIAAPAVSEARAALTAEDPSGCVEKKIEQFGPNNDSNYFSIIIKKNRTISLNVYANGFQSKIVTIDGGKAKFIVLNIDLGVTIEPCYFSAGSAGDPSVQVGYAEGGTGVGAPIESTKIALLRSPENSVSDREKPWTCGPISEPPVAVDAVPPPRACEEIYAPVCGNPNPTLGCGTGGKLCSQMAPAPTTYGNKCSLENAGATLIHEGECTANENPLAK